MGSESSKDQIPDDMRDDIVDNAASVPDGDDVLSLRDRIDDLEFLVEEISQARELQIELEKYIDDLREELADIRNYRFYITMFASFKAVVLFFVMFFLLVVRPTWFLDLEGRLQVTLIMALGAASVFLMSILMRGVYRSRHERHDGEMVPEPVKIALTALKRSS